ncbi:[FeFe] hydrogenase H-cluster radical SAM maturase HydG [Candidatus Margulisiibacteriota bacterium]
MSIDQEKILRALDTPASLTRVREILIKAKQLQRLSLEETAVLLNIEDENLLAECLQAAREVKDSIYGKRLVIFAPLYISNLCNNECLYCAFRASNTMVSRKALTQAEIKQETEHLLRTGQKRVLLVSGEAYPKEGLDYVMKAIETVYAARDGQNSIRRINVNIAPLEVAEFKRLKEANIGTYQLFQETYHRETYNKLHLKGQKSDYDYRISAIDRAFSAGIDDVGIGVLFGLYDYKYEVLALMSHIEHLEQTFGMGPHTISVPRLEPATGSDIATHPPYPVSDINFKKVIAALRLAVPYTGIILSTRETPQIRRDSLDLGVSQISAGSRTNPGGYSEQESAEQFSLGDHRALDEVIYDICQKGYLPSFCTSCYRLGRTGLDFMEYAKPGDIKKKCLPNALFTFQEYLQDYASPKTRALGEKLIARQLADLPEGIRDKSSKFVEKVKTGQRDLCV